MKTSALPLALLAIMAGCLVPQAAQAATVSVGGLVVIGFNDNNQGDEDQILEDSFALLATEDIEAGTTIYFTNNAWHTGTMSFQGAGDGTGQGDGLEQVMKLTVSGTISAGTIFTSLDTSTDFAWTTSGAIDGVANSFYSSLQLKNVTTQGYSDEIYIFQASGSNPLFNPSDFIYLLSFGDDNDPGFSDPLTNYDLGNVPDGQVSTDGGNTWTTTNALSNTEDLENPQPNDNTAVYLDPGGGYNNGWFGINLSSGLGLSYFENGASKEDWLRYINDTNHWESRGSNDLPSGSLTILGVPEPSRALLALSGLMSLLLRRRREGWEKPSPTPRRASPEPCV